MLKNTIPLKNASCEVFDACKILFMTITNSLTNTCRLVATSLLGLVLGDLADAQSGPHCCCKVVVFYIFYNIYYILYDDIIYYVIRSTHRTRALHRLHCNLK